MNCKTCEYGQVAYKDGEAPKLYCLHDQAEHFLKVVDNAEACKHYFAQEVKDEN